MHIAHTQHGEGEYIRVGLAAVQYHNQTEDLTRSEEELTQYSATANSIQEREDTPADKMKLLLCITVALISIGAAVGQAPFFDFFRRESAGANVIFLECLGSTGNFISGSSFFANISNAIVPVVGTAVGPGQLRFTITQDTEGFYFCQSTGVNSTSVAILGE